MDDIEFPKSLYQCPGGHGKQDGVGYDFIIVQDQSALDKMLGAGWFATLLDARNAYQQEQKP